MSFHEKNAWACLISIILVFGPYLSIVLQQPTAFVGLFPLAVIILVVLLTGFHIVNALVTRSIRNTGDEPRPDELDRMIELRAAKLSGIVLAVAVIGWCMMAMLMVPTIGVRDLAHALIAIHLLFAGFVIANTAYYGSIIAGYRRLANG